MLYFSHLLCDGEMKEIIEETGMGVESIEFSIAENLDSLDKKLLSYEKRLGYMGCEHVLLHGPFLDLNPMSYDRAIQEATLLRYEQAYTAAKKLGAKKLIYHTCYVPDFYLLTGWAERVAAFYRNFLEGKDETVEILMENVLDRTPKPLTETAQNVGLPAFGLCLDVGHANCYSPLSCTAWAEEEGEYLRHLHLHDNLGDRDSHLAFGTGTVSTEIVRQALGKNRGRTGTIECSSFEAVLSSYKVINRLLKEE